MPDAFDLRDLVAALADDRHDFAEFFRSPTGSLSLTVARWPAGSVDDQRPHTEDEVYYVAAGRGQLTVAGQTTSVGPGRWHSWPRASSTASPRSPGARVLVAGA